MSQSTTANTTSNNNDTGGLAAYIFIAAVLGIVGILVVPLPPVVLDALLAVSIAASLLVLLVSLRVQTVLDFSVFPTLLLLVTLFRLGLNVATTRLILLHGSEGANGVGHIIEAFGQFAVGGSVLVGAVVFLILMIINFAVITKGSGRVAEVAARFTLDAMPGKQMAIDADLAAGHIDEKEAKRRRRKLEQESEFYGAMDGANKFVRGDAIAGLAITGINIVGGLIAGVLRDNMPIAKAVEVYTILSIGDGLVSQIPSLLISMAAGVIVTRAGTDGLLERQLAAQVLSNRDALRSGAVVLLILGLLPGMPLLAFGAASAGLFVMAQRLQGDKTDKNGAAKAKNLDKNGDKAEEPKPERLQDLLALDTLEVQLGYALIKLIDLEKGGELPGRITALRRQVATDLGVVLPPVHLRDSLKLTPNEYKVFLRGVEIGGGTAYVDRLMVLDPGGRDPVIEGIAAKEPAFGLPARWINTTDRLKAESRGLSVIESSAVVATHLSELLRRATHELVGRQEVQELLTLCAKESPKLVEDVVPNSISLGELVRVVRGLLRENVSVRDLRTILEAVADAAPRSKETNFLVDQARLRLARQITSNFSKDGVVRPIALERATEMQLRQSLAVQDGEPQLAPDLDTARRLIAELEAQAATLHAAGAPAVVLAPPDLRRPLFDFASRFVPDINVICARELAHGTQVDPVGMIKVASPRGVGTA